MSHSSRDITHPTPFTIIQTNASTLGWGAVYADQEVGGRWTSLESSSHINILELQAAFFALKSFCKGTIKGHVQLQIGPCKRNFDHPSVASSNLVLTGTTAAMQSALNYETFEEPTATCQPTSTPAAQQATPNGLSALRESFTQYNVSPDITKILMTSWRVGTQKWLAFRHKRGITYSSPKINDKYSTICIFRPLLLLTVGNTLVCTPWLYASLKAFMNSENPSPNTAVFGMFLKF